MIEKLNNKNFDISKKIHSVFQVSYAAEAKLLNAIDFPPLKRTIDDFLNSSTEFYGFWKDKEIVAIIEIESDKSLTHIDSLVVDPRFFRQGIARKLIAFVLDSIDSKKFTVDTAVENIPACQLYKKFEFEEVKQWDTEEGIRIIRFAKKN
jgi:ribosomal protein S18 acetylase RimI-like enzyme